MKRLYILLSLFLFVCLITACVGNRKLQGDISESIRQSAESDGRLSATVEQLAEADKRIADTGRQLGELSDNIRNSLRGIRDTEWEAYGSIQQLQRIIDEYNNLLERVLREVDNLRTEVENKKQYIDSNDYSVYNFIVDESSRIYSLC